MKMKSKIIVKKQILIFTLVLTFCVAVFVNWYYTKQDNVTTPDVSSKVNLGDAQYVNSDNVSFDKENYYKEALLNRTKAHDTSIEHLKSIISDSSNDTETVNLAQERLLRISEQIKMETDIENLIKAKLECECLVTYNDDQIDVIISGITMNDDNALLIKNIILSKTPVSADKLTIVEI